MSLKFIDSNGNEKSIAGFTGSAEDATPSEFVNIRGTYNLEFDDDTGECTSEIRYWPFFKTAIYDAFQGLTYNIQGSFDNKSRFISSNINFNLNIPSNLNMGLDSGGPDLDGYYYENNTTLAAMFDFVYINKIGLCIKIDPTNADSNYSSVLFNLKIRENGNTTVTDNRVIYNKDTYYTQAQIDEGSYTISYKLSDNKSKLITKDLINVASNLYPIGSIYMSINDTDPSTYFGGTWERFGKGRTIVGVNEDDTNFATAQQTGGENTHTLTKAELPNYTLYSASHGHTASDSGHTHTVSYVNGYGTGSTYGVGYSGIATVQSSGTFNTGSGKANITVNGSTITVSSGGSGTAMNNMQAYITTYMWLRTA